MTTASEFEVPTFDTVLAKATSGIKFDPVGNLPRLTLAVGLVAGFMAGEGASVPEPGTSAAEAFRLTLVEVVSVCGSWLRSLGVVDPGGAIVDCYDLMDEEIADGGGVAQTEMLDHLVAHLGLVASAALEGSRRDLSVWLAWCGVLAATWALRYTPGARVAPPVSRSGHDW